MTDGATGPIYRGRHGLVVTSIVAVAIVITFISELAVVLLSQLTFTMPERWALFGYAFVAAWWLIYFSSAKTGLPTLRLFLRQGWLDDKPEVEPNYSELADAMNTKCASLIEAQGIYIAVISLLLAYVVELSGLTDFQVILSRVAVTAALIAILLLVMSSDMLDTASNRFRSQAVDRQVWEFKKKFYAGISPPGMRRGFSYLGFAVFTFFIIISISLIWPPLTGIAVAVLGYFGYPYWFGYERAVGASGTADFRHSEGIAWPSILIGASFLIVTTLIAVIY